MLFADYAELTQGMRQATLRGMRALLAENGKLAANGARRTDGEINELTHAVYTTCDLCKTDPSKPPLWQLRALTATQDLEHKRIEYHDAVLDMWGLRSPTCPTSRTPTHRCAVQRLPGADHRRGEPCRHLLRPAILLGDRRQSGRDDHPEIASESGQQLSAEYRRRFNNGALSVDAAGALMHGTPEGYIFAKGDFNYNDTWRYGFTFNRATSAHLPRGLPGPELQQPADQLGLCRRLRSRRLHQAGRDFLPGPGDFHRAVATALRPARYEYSYFSEPDFLGGRWRFDTEDFNIVREVGTNTQRAGGSVDWQRPFAGDLGERYTITIHADVAAYNANDLNQQPTYGTCHQHRHRPRPAAGRRHDALAFHPRRRRQRHPAY